MRFNYDHPEFFNIHFSPSDEIWVVVPLCEDYSISNYGRLKSTKRELHKILRGAISKGYHQYILSINGRAVSLKAHYLVLLCFCGDREKHQEVNHIDGKKPNNHISNLEYVSHRQNMAHAKRNGLMMCGAAHYRAKMDEEMVIKVRDLYLYGKSLEDIFLIFKINMGTLRNAIHGITWAKVDYYPGLPDKATLNRFKVPKESFYYGMYD